MPRLLVHVVVCFFHLFVSLADASTVSYLISSDRTGPSSTFVTVIGAYLRTS